MKDRGNRRERRLMLAAYAAAALLAGAGVVELATRARRGAPEEAARVGAFAPPVLRPASPDDLTSRSLTPPEPNAYEQLMDLLQPAATQPAALAFAEEFQKDPALEELFDGFKEDQENGPPSQTLEGLAKALSAKSEFRQLVSKFAQEPGFRQAAAPLLQDPRLRPAVRETIARLSVQARQRTAPPALARGIPPIPAKAAAFAASATGARPEGTAAAPAVRAGDTRRAESAPPSGPGADPRPGERAHDTVSLAKIPAVGASTESSATASTRAPSPRSSGATCTSASRTARSRSSPRTCGTGRRSA